MKEKHKTSAWLMILVMFVAPANMKLQVLSNLTTQLMLTLKAPPNNASSISE